MLLSRRPAYKSLGTSQWVFLALAAASAMALVPACSPVAPGGDGDGNGGDGDGDIGGGLNPGDGDGDIGGIPGDGDGDGDGGGGPSGNYCNDFKLDFTPKTPTVYILVDRSSSMFGDQMFWTTLKSGVLPVVNQLQADVRFGFGSYTGQNGTCMGLTPGAPIEANNYAAIEAAYNSLAAPMGKGETPTALAISQASNLLLADTSPGDRFILLVTDGDPDFCDDPDPRCGADALIASLQVAASKGVQTLVFGIENDGIKNPLWFDYFAQAGQGQLPAMADGVDPNSGLKNCSGGTGDGAWSVFRTANGGSTDTAAGMYSPEGGTASAFLDADPAALATKIQASVAGLKSCTFDFNFDVKDTSRGDIFVGDLVTPIPKEDWTMPTTSSLELVGASCESWKSEGVTEFFAGFPCDAIIVK